MTDATEAATEQTAVMEQSPSSPARSVIGLAGIFLLVAAAGGFVTALQLVFPANLSGSAFFTFGKLTPISGSALLIGWLAVAGIAVVYHVVVTATARPLVGGSAAWAGPGLVATGTLAGLVGIASGGNTGIEHFEMPIWSAVIVAAGLAVAAGVVVRSVVAAGPETSDPAVWFSVAGVVWALLAYVAGSIPGIVGINVAFQTWFAYSGLVVGGLLALAVAGVYYVLSDLGGERSERGGALSYIGFWSLVFVSGWLGPRFLTHGPAPDWLETVGVLFALVMFIPVWVILSDFAEAGRDRWRQLARHTSIKFVIAGAALLALVPVQGVLHAFRSSSAVVQFTAWDTAFDYLLPGGAITMWMLAFAYRAVPGLAARDTSRASGWHLWLTVTGVGAVLAASWLAGLQQGYTWVGLVNAGDVGNNGAGFINSVEPLEAWYGLRAIGAGVFAVAQFLLLPGLFGAGGKVVELEGLGEADDEEEELERRSIETKTLVRGVVGLVLLAALSVFVVPSIEKENTTETVLGNSRDFAAGSVQAQGREIYLEEGCWYCHTQQVRAVPADVGLGPVSRPGDYANETPALLGSARIGPDLMHAGGEGRESESVEWTARHLEFPRSDRPWSIMPSYQHLSNSELNALAEYIAALK